MKSIGRGQRWAASYALAAMGIAALIAGVDPAGAEEHLVDGVAAQVGSEVVLVSEVLEVASPVEEEMRAANAPPEQIASVRPQVLERLIENKLISATARRLELRATAAEVDDAIRGISQETKLSLRQLIESVTSHGLTFEEYRQKIADEIERTKVINALVRGQVRLEEKEVENLYAQRYAKQATGGEEVHLLYLAVAYGPQMMRDRATACALAAEGAERIRSGEYSFEFVARRISSDNASNGGDMGWVHVKDLASWMTPIVKNLDPGQLSEVVETPLGCSVLQVRDRREFQPVTFESIRADLENEIFRVKTEERYLEWLEGLRTQTYIERKGVFASSSSFGTE